MGLDINATFKLEKDTKGAVRYQEEGHAPSIGTLYIRKHAFDSADFDDEIEVIVRPKKKAK